MVTSGTRTKGNVDIPDLLLTHTQEEADTLLMLRAVSVPHKAELVVTCVATRPYVSTVHTCQFLQSSSLEKAG